MRTYRVDLKRVYTTFIVAKDKKEALEKAEKMNEAQVEEAATYVSDFEVTNIESVTLLKNYDVE